MNDGVFGANSGQKKALGDDGVFDATNSGARKATGGALAKVDNGKGSALAEYVKEGAGKLAAVIAAGKDVQMDAQRVMFFLASYGEGDRLGRYVFTSLELVGREEHQYDVKEMEWEPEKATPENPNPIGSGKQVMKTTQKTAPAQPRSEDGAKLGISGIRLRDAVHLLRDRQWVETTDDGEFGQDCDFATVKLTAKGRELALISVKKHMQKGGASFEEGGFAGMPDLFDLGGGGSGSAPQLTELQQQQSMLTRAQVPFRVEHEGSGDDARSIILINDKPSFVFDAKGALVNAEKDAKTSAP